MNKNDILNTPAGKRMNQLIWWKIFDMMPTPPNNDLDFLPDYSGEISPAWSVVEKIKNHKEGRWCPRIYWDDNDGVDSGNWVAEFDGRWEVENYYRHYEAIADTAPLAICRAALFMYQEIEDEQ